MNKLELLRLQLAGAAAPALGSDCGDPLNGTWRVCLDDFLPPAEKMTATARRCLPTYVISRDGTFLYGLGSAPEWNQTTCPADGPSLRHAAASGRLSGALVVPHEILGAVGDAAPVYTLRLDSRRISNLCGGEAIPQHFSKAAKAYTYLKERLAAGSVGNARPTEPRP